MVDEAAAGAALDGPAALLKAGEVLRAIVADEITPELERTIDQYQSAAHSIERAWSGSNFGYHARVYYANFEEPPPGAYFSMEWGDMALFSQGTRGDWREFSRHDIQRALDHLIGVAGVDTQVRAAGKKIQEAIDEARDDGLSLLSLLSLALTVEEDPFLRKLYESIEKSHVPSERDFLQGQMPRQGISRDMRAVQEGVVSTVHQEALAIVVVTRQAAKVAGDLAALLERAAAHIERRKVGLSKGHVIDRPVADSAFSDDGRSPVWRDMYEYDFFICHASEDKAEFIEPLAEELQRLGFRVWYDAFTLTVGDSLRRSIDEGLRNSRFGVVVLSQAFFQKGWANAELDGLTTRQRAETKVILPVWHKVDQPEVAKFSLTSMIQGAGGTGY